MEADDWAAVLPHALAGEIVVEAATFACFSRPEYWLRIAWSSDEATLEDEGVPVAVLPVAARALARRVAEAWTTPSAEPAIGSTTRHRASVQWSYRDADGAWHRGVACCESVPRAAISDQLSRRGRTPAVLIAGPAWLSAARAASLVAVASSISEEHAPLTPAVKAVLDDLAAGFSERVLRRRLKALGSSAVQLVPHLLHGLRGDDGSAGPENPCYRALLALGATAVPSLRLHTVHRDPGVRLWAERLLLDLDAHPAGPELVRRARRLDDPDAGVRAVAVREALDGPPDQIAELARLALRLIAFETYQGFTERALPALGPAALPALTEALLAPNPRIGRAAASALNGLGDAAGPAIPALVAAVQQIPDEDPRRPIVAETLVRFGARAAGALADVLRHRRAGVVALLLRIGGAVVPHVVPLLDSEDATTRYNAVDLLRRLGPAAASAAPHIRALAGDPDPRVAAEVREVLARIVGPSR